MKQTDKAATASSSHTNIRLDPLSKAKLEYCKGWFKHHGEDVSGSMVFRRAIELLTDRLSQYCEGRTERGMKEYELLHVLSCTQNKPDPFNGEFPWTHLEKTSKFKPFSSYGTKAFFEDISFEGHPAFIK